MLRYFAPYSRLFVLICAAVMMFVMCSDATRASPTMTQEHSGVKHKVLRRPLTIIDRQSSPLTFTHGSFDFNQHSPDNRQSRATIIKVQRGHSAGGMRPAIQHEGQSFERLQSSGNYHTRSQDVAQTADSYNSHSVISRTSSPKTARSPFHQSFSQIWDHGYPQESYNEEEVPKSDAAKVDEDKSGRKSFYSSLFPSKTSQGGYWRTLPPATRGHYSSYEETNELPAVGAQSTSSGIQSSKFLSFPSHTAPHATSISNSLDASVIKRNPSPDKLTSSITDFSQRLDSASSSETQRHKKVQSYLFKNSQTSVNTVTSDGQEALSGRSNAATVPHKQMPTGADVYSRFSSTLKQLPTKDPTKQDNLVYHNAIVGQYGGQKHSFTKYQPISSLYSPLDITAQSPSQLSLHPASLKSKSVVSFAPTPHANSWNSSASSSEKSVLVGRVNTSTGESVHDYKPGRSTQSIDGFARFKNPPSQAVKESAVPSSKETSNSHQHSSDKGQDYKFKVVKRYPSLSAKYSFGQRGASTTTMPPRKLERIPTSYSSPSGGTLEVIRSTTVSPPRLFTSGFKGIQHLNPASDAGEDRNPNYRQFKTDKRMYRLKEFGTEPLEGAKTLQTDKSATLPQGFQSFNLMHSQTWQPKNMRFQGWYNHRGETVSSGSDTSTVSQNEFSSEDLKPLLTTAGSTESIPRFTPGKSNGNIYTGLGFQSIKNRTTTSPRSSGYLSSAGGLGVEPSPTQEPRTPNKNKPVPAKAVLLNTFSRGTERGTPAKVKHTNSKKPGESRLTSDIGNAVIVRLPKNPARVKAVTYTDSIGSASFSSVRATDQTTITPADEEYLTNMTATTKQKGNLGDGSLNSDGGVHSGENTTAEANAEDEREDFSSAEEDKLGKSEEDDDGIKTFDLFLDQEGSGDFNLSALISARAGSLALGGDLAELDYLQTSTGNISFTSVNVSHPDKQ